MTGGGDLHWTLEYYTHICTADSVAICSVVICSVVDPICTADSGRQPACGVYGSLCLARFVSHSHFILQHTFFCFVGIALTLYFAGTLPYVLPAQCICPPTLFTLAKFTLKHYSHLLLLYIGCNTVAILYKARRKVGRKSRGQQGAVWAPDAGCGNDCDDDDDCDDDCDDDDDDCDRTTYWEDPYMSHVGQQLSVFSDPLLVSR